MELETPPLGEELPELANRPGAGVRDQLLPADIRYPARGCVW